MRSPRSASRVPRSLKGSPLMQHDLWVPLGRRLKLRGAGRAAPPWIQWAEGRYPHRQSPERWSETTRKTQGKVHALCPRVVLGNASPFLAVFPFPLFHSCASCRLETISRFNKNEGRRYLIKERPPRHCQGSARECAYKNQNQARHRPRRRHRRRHRGPTTPPPLPLTFYSV